MKQYIKTAVLASAGLALASASAFAQGYNDQDLILSFGQSGANNFAVDLGPVSQFSASASFNITALNGADLLNNYSHNLAGVVWSVYEGNYASGSASTYQAVLSSSSSTPWNKMGSAALKTLDSAINTYGPVNVFGSLGSTATQVGSSLTESLDPVGNANSFAKFGPQVNGKFAQGSTYVGDGTTFQSTGYLTDITVGTGAGTLLGGLTIDGTTGNASWTGAAAVPEPGTYGLLAACGLLVLSLRRSLGVGSRVS